MSSRLLKGKFFGGGEWVNQYTSAPPRSNKVQFSFFH
jgi:hypothetical protein